MGPKKATNEELLAQFDELDEPKVKSKAKKDDAKKEAKDDPLAELENLAQERPKSRPHTPRLTGAQASPKKSEEIPRKSGEATRAFHQATSAEDAPGVDASQEKAEASSPNAGWWGGIVATASAAVKQAEALAKEIQKNEEAQRWAEQVKGNVGALRTYGDELRSKAMPTFSNILHTLAPPISSHERLQIHITQDLIGYPSLDPLIYQTFSRVMQQVEGGDLMVVQRGQESAPRSTSGGWNDGPWYRHTAKRDIGAVKGLVEGTKLSKANAESYSHEFFASRGGVEEAAKRATEVLSESNPTRSSDIFLAIQAIFHDEDKDLFGGTKEEEGVAAPKPEELATFAIYLHDPLHSINFHSLTQSVPRRWVGWLDNPEGEGVSDGALPEDIREIVEDGGVDPREWVSEWIEEVLAAGVGIVAQKYVARRMGIGEGGLGRGKAREATVDAGAGEAARAL